MVSKQGPASIGCDLSHAFSCGRLSVLCAKCDICCALVITMLLMCELIWLTDSFIVKATRLIIELNYVQWYRPVILYSCR